MMEYFTPRGINNGNRFWIKTDCDYKLSYLSSEYKFDAGSSMNIQYSGVSPTVIVAASVQASWYKLNTLHLYCPLCAVVTQGI